MTIQKLALEPGVNREKTSYSNENSWFECDKVRFRQGYAERIGGWTRISANSFLGVCRSLFNWISLAGANYLGVGTNLKFYIGQGGAYYDVTPLRSTTAAGDVTFAASNGSSTLTVSDTVGSLFIILGLFVYSPHQWPILSVVTISFVLWNTIFSYLLAVLSNR